MVRLKKGVKIVAVDDVYGTPEKPGYGIYFNTRNMIVAPIFIFDLITMLNGFFTVSDIEVHFAEQGIDNKQIQEIIAKLFEWDLIEEID